MLLCYKTCRGVSFKHIEEKMEIKDSETKIPFRIMLEMYKVTS